MFEVTASEEDKSKSGAENDATHGIKYDAA